MSETKVEIKYPRLYLSLATHKRIARIAKKQKTNMKFIGEAAIKAGIRALGF